MLIPLPGVIDRYDLHLSGCVHVGAHEGQEAQTYVDCRIDKVAWIEANPATLPALRAHVEPFGHSVIEACVGETTGAPVTFHVAEADNYSNRGQSSSILPLGTHRDRHPEVSYVADLAMQTTTLDDLCDAHNIGGPGWDLLVADVQGAELLVLRGAQRMLEHVTLVYLEVNIEPLYEGCGLFDEVDELLVDAGFECQEVMLAGCQRADCGDGGNRWVGWGDGIWLRTPDPRPFMETHPDQHAGWHTIERRDRRASIRSKRRR